ncbi:MAG: nitrous oxide reductase accessory protein NosL [Gammaproteobacteria bacterium]|nr:nitrous oxide reductase accessory protein NosL [Gammaproteobacteria bacterium]
MNTIYKTTFLLVAVLLTACEKTQPVEVPPAQTLTREASGYYCLMTVLHHSGPKAQIFLDDQAEPLWFTSVRDAISFTLSPEEPKNISAIYVNDMTDADWDNPGVDNWIEASKAWYVIASKRSGGMGSPEAIPFSTKENAETFAKEEGGTVYDLLTIPHDYILESSE